MTIACVTHVRRDRAPITLSALRAARLYYGERNPMIADAELLARYAASKDQAAFAELVQRHLNLVYSAALRQVHGDAHLAQDVTQLVFTDLARKAAKLQHHAVLTGWLYTGTRYAALQAVRGERRRQNREQEAQHMHDVSTPEATPADWQQLHPVLDEVMHDLGERDREAVLLRFFESQPFAEIGGRLGISEEAARKRVHRALDALRDALGRRGVTSTGAAIGLVLAERAVAAAPAGLGVSVTSAAVTGAATAGALSLWQLLASTKVLTSAAAALVVGGTIVAVLEHRANERLRAEIAASETANAVLARAAAPEGQPAAVKALEQQLAAARTAADARRAANARAASTAPAGNAGASTMAAALSSPRQRLLYRSALDRGFAPLLRQLALPPAERAQLIELLLDRSVATTAAQSRAQAEGVDVSSPAAMKILTRAAQADIDRQIAALLGPAKFATFQAYDETIAHRYMVNSMVEQLAPTPTPLTDAQADAIVQAIARHADPENRGDITDAAVAAVAPQLAPPQLAVLREAQASRRASRELMELNRAAALAGRLLLSEQSLRDYPPPPGSPAHGAPTVTSNLNTFSDARISPTTLVSATYRQSRAADALGLYARLVGRQLDIAPAVFASSLTFTLEFQEMPPNGAAFLLRSALERAGLQFSPLNATTDSVRLRPTPSS